MINNEVKLANDWEKCEELYWKLHKLKLCKDAFEGLWKEEEEGVLKESKHYYVTGSRTTLEGFLNGFADDFNKEVISYINNN